jgi:homoserine dehydrogenase
MEEEPLARVALLGFGTVGSAVARRLTAGTHHLELTYIFDRRAALKQAAFPSRAIWTSRIDDILESSADIVVEAIGGLDPAAEFIRLALLSGKSVVTANKQVIARHGHALLTLASRQGRQLRFEAAVCGAMPIVRAVGEGLTGDRLTRVTAVLNGTTNAVLSQMDTTGCTQDEALADARARGYAEADPSADLDGADAAAKLSILCALAFGLRVEPARIETRSSASVGPADFVAARRRSGTIRQLAHAEYDRTHSVLTVWVAPVWVSGGSLFARTTGPQNAALVTGEAAGEIGIFGAGAGGDATSVAVISDAVAIARDRAAVVPAPVLKTPRTIIGLPASGVNLPTADFQLQTSNVSLAEAV